MDCRKKSADSLIFITGKGSRWPLSCALIYFNALPQQVALPASASAFCSRLFGPVIACRDLKQIHAIRSTMCSQSAIILDLWSWSSLYPCAAEYEGQLISYVQSILSPHLLLCHGGGLYYTSNYVHWLFRKRTTVHSRQGMVQSY